MSMLSNTTAAALMTAMMLGAAMSAPSAAETAVSLFKVVSVKDEIVVGLTDAELAGIAVTGEEKVAVVARAIADRGPLTVWQYAVRKGADGALEQAPLKRVSLLAHESIRVEPYDTRLRIVDRP